MPHNNRMTTTGTLKTNDIWSKTIGHNPYANAAVDEEEEDGGKPTAEMEEKVKIIRA